MIKKCKICGTEFEAKSNRACYCSDECKKEGRKRKNYDNNKWNREHTFESNKFNRLNPDKANKFNRLNPDKANKWNKEQLDDANKQFHEINDGYNSSLKINYQTKKLEEAYGSKDAEKESYKYDTKSKQCKKEWAKAEEQMKPLFWKR